MLKDRGARAASRGVREESAEVQETKKQAQLRKTVLCMLARGQVGKAVRLIKSHGIAPMEELWVRQAMAAKYPARGRDLPDSVTRGQCLDSLPRLRESILELLPGVSPGFGGLRNEHLRVLAEVWGEQEMNRLETFSLRYLNAGLPKWLYVVWGSVTTVPLFKTEEQESLRPVGVKSSFLRLLHSRVVTGNRAALTSFLEPQQVALSRAGGFILVHGVRMQVEQMKGKKDWVAVKLDISNAHNEVSRAAVVEVLENTPELRHLALFAATCLAGHQGLESRGEMWGRTGEGETQGDPVAGPWFCVAWHPFVRELDATLRAAGGGALFGNDDGYLIGPARVVFPSLDRFSAQIEETCLLKLQVSKTEVFSWETVLPPEVSQTMRRAGAMVEGTWEPGFMCYGIAVGSNVFVRQKLEAKVDEVLSVVMRVKEVLGPKKDFQAIWCILRCSLCQMLDWQLSLNYPKDVAAPAERLDTALEVAGVCHLSPHP